ncbi:Defensin-like protein 260 [Arabidopsis thaliana]|uniref:Defensin-like protein 260 n=3 Tax=Arabidopsis TaxID=3701 RepID=DF260_ARATH|nr:Defensin-like (DEFL) family protein [Arabidopsis thaliana]Q9LMX3.1 RecName: Full=Defensin-like protein 260; Flags: Precursor [Arabidopsis thaliana]KAG7646211.1 hypothetical protein ISN45_At01g013830 [Arabidopsis thaliana x Arabidopsis arenosa]AAF81301.1 Contains similarity to Balbiani ring protein 3 precursor from Chironomus tentans gb/X52263 [Arabidopsis thaliana]ABI34006.1 unknown [Arabidopsis thaliana]AEE29064.1 Defensin-like (DEFL) family protein [Arabidopsis thaliana]OAP13181.1 hypoth|eukprot:NP_001031043.1 Defensin-like (DEFL) family protein [Arabidopsis thaliana]
MKIASLKLLLLVSLLFAVTQNGISIQNSETSVNQNSCMPNEPRCTGCPGGGSGGYRGPPPPCCKNDSDCKAHCPEGGYCSNQCDCVCNLVKVMNNDVRCQVDTDCNMKCSKQGYCKLAS